MKKFYICSDVTHTRIFHTQLYHTQFFTHIFFNFSILHHLLCLSFLPRPATTFASAYWKKLTCGVFRSFNFQPYCHGYVMREDTIYIHSANNTIWVCTLGIYPAGLAMKSCVDQVDTLPELGDLFSSPR